MAERSDAVEPQAVRDASAAYSVEADIAPAEDVPPGYKRTDAGVIPRAWHSSSLESVGIDPSVKAGPFGSSLTKASYTRSGYKVYGQEQVIRGDHHFGDYFISEEKYRQLRSCSIRPRDVLISLVGTAGKALLIPDDAPPGIINPRLVRVRLNQEQVDPLFFKYLFESNQVQDSLIGHAQGGTMDVLNARILRALRLPIPLLQEQRAIATALSDADALIESLDCLIAKKRAIKQAAMQQLLTGQTRLPGFTGEWETRRLGDIADIVMGQSPRSSNYNSRGDGIPLVQGNADIAYRRTIKRIFTTQITKRGRAGDILMSVRAPVGEISRALFDVCLGRGVCALRFPNDFLYHCLIFIEPAWAKHSRGSTFDSVNSADVKAVEIKLPIDPEEQTAIATVLSDMDTEIEALEHRRDKARQIKQGMMQQLLTGRVRLVKPEVAA